MEKGENQLHVGKLKENLTIKQKMASLTINASMVPPAPGTSPPPLGNIFLSTLSEPLNIVQYLNEGVNKLHARQLMENLTI